MRPRPVDSRRAIPVSGPGSPFPPRPLRPPIPPLVLAYRHQFHAGNFADVFKHALLTQLMLALGKKDKPMFCLDTHAGTGLYDLTHPWAQKNAEHGDGIARVWGRRSDAPPELMPYLDA